MAVKVTEPMAVKVTDHSFRNPVSWDPLAWLAAVRFAWRPQVADRRGARSRARPGRQDRAGSLRLREP